MKKLIIWTNFDEAMEDLSWAERGRLFTAMLQYAADDSKQPDVISGNEKFLWRVQRQSIDAQWESYRKQCDRADVARSNNPKNTDISQNVSNVRSDTSEVRNEESEISTNIIKDQYQDQEKKRKAKDKKTEGGTRFCAPSVEEVKAYCLERGNGIDPQAFIDFYQARNWHYGTTAIRDWKACIRTWEKRAEERKPKGTYEQRKVTDADFSDLFLNLDA